MSDLIDRQALLKQIDIDSDGEPGYYGDTWKFIDTIKNMPNVHDLPKDADTISRQAAIDAIEHLEIPEDMCVFEILSHIELEIGTLPSAQLDTYWKEQCQSYEQTINKLRESLSTQPEIIRCKDCKHWIPYDWMFSEIWQSKNMADYHENEIGCNLCDMAMKSNDFCSRGEKREVTT